MPNINFVITGPDDDVRLLQIISQAVAAGYKITTARTKKPDPLPPPHYSIPKKEEPKVPVTYLPARHKYAKRRKFSNPSGLTAKETVLKFLRTQPNGEAFQEDIGLHPRQIGYSMSTTEPTLSELAKYGKVTRDVEIVKLVTK